MSTRKGPEGPLVSRAEVNKKAARCLKPNRLASRVSCLQGAHARGRFSSSTSTYGHLGTISRNSPVGLSCIVSFRERNSKDRMLGSRYALNSSTMGVYDFLRNGQTRPAPPRFVARGIQAVKLLKITFELWRGNGVS